MCSQCSHVFLSLQSGTMAWNDINWLVCPVRMLLLKSGDNSLNINHSTTDSARSLLGNHPHCMYLQLLANVCCVRLKTFISFYWMFKVSRYLASKVWEWKNISLLNLVPQYWKSNIALWWFRCLRTHLSFL